MSLKRLSLAHYSTWGLMVTESCHSICCVECLISLLEQLRLMWKAPIAILVALSVCKKESFFDWVQVFVFLLKLVSFILFLKFNFRWEVDSVSTQQRGCLAQENSWSLPPRHFTEQAAQKERDVQRHKRALHTCEIEALSTNGKHEHRLYAFVARRCHQATFQSVVWREQSRLIN